MILAPPLSRPKAGRGEGKGGEVRLNKYMEVKQMYRPNDRWRVVRPTEGAPGTALCSFRLPNARALVLITCLIGLFVIGFLPVAWTTPGQAQAAGLNWTVPTRTPGPTLSHKTYLPILVRAQQR